MDRQEAERIVTGLCAKALKHDSATEAMKLSQAAVNCANAYCSLASFMRG